MKRAVLSLIITIVLSFQFANCQPWENPLNIAWSTDGINFTTPGTFQDSSGVPCAIKWKGDTLVCVFQWFRQPQGSLTWDRVAVKFSYDAGLNWTDPVPIVINGLPVNYQRPFDPTIVKTSGDSIRIFYSSSDGIPPLGLDSTVNTYSAIGIDGINYTFEPNARFDHLTNKVIDPAVTIFNGIWHYACPIGPPQAGAYHCSSPDGLNFVQHPDYPSDATHNWTGNLMVESSSEMRFYGSGSLLWYNSTPNGGTWNGYVNTNLTGGDPSVVKVSPSNYMIIYVGHPYSSGMYKNETEETKIFLYPNPSTDFISVKVSGSEIQTYNIYSYTGRFLLSGTIDGDNNIDITNLFPGVYFITLFYNNKATTVSFVKEGNK